MITDEEKKRDEAIDHIVNKIVVEYGKDSAQLLSDEDNWSNVTSWIGTGSVIIDSAISGAVDGSSPIIPFGRFTEISGPENTGKTTLIAQIIKNVQSMKGIVVMAETENALDIHYLKLLGININKIIYVPAPTLEDVFGKFRDIVYEIKKYGEDIPVLLTMDSLGAIMTKSELESEKPTDTMMAAPRVISYNMKKILPVLGQTRAAFIISNHLYTNPAAQGRFGHDQEEYITPGGMKLRYLATLRIRLKKSRSITESVKDGGEETIGRWIEISVFKNKIIGFERKIKVPILSGVGFSDDYAMFESSKVNKRTKSAQSSSVIKLGNDEITYKGWNSFIKKVVTHPAYEKYKLDVIKRFFKNRFEDDDLE